jgi:hypothetical protein
MLRPVAIGQFRIEMQIVDAVIAHRWPRDAETLGDVGPRQPGATAGDDGAIPFGPKDHAIKHGSEAIGVAERDGNPVRAEACDWPPLNRFKGLVGRYRLQISRGKG